MLTLDVDLTAVMWTSYLSLHYFRKNASKSGKLVMTASAAALYPSPHLPVYAAAKSAVRLFFLPSSLPSLLVSPPLGTRGRKMAAVVVVVV